jgi:integrase/recombinase XerD
MVVLRLSYYARCDGSKQVVYYLRYRRRIIAIDTGVVVRDGEWNGSAVLPKHPGGKRLVMMLSEKLTDLNRVYFDGVLMRWSYDVMKDALYRCLDGVDGRMLLEAFEQLLQEKKQKSLSTYNLYLSVYKRLRDVGDVQLDRVDFDYINSWVMKMERDGLNLNTQRSYVRRLGVFFVYARNKGWYNGEDVLRLIKVRAMPVRKRALDGEGVRVLWKHREKLTGIKRRSVDYFFCLIFLRGTDYVDFHKLRLSDVKSGRWMYARSKSGSLIDVRIEPEFLALASPYMFDDCFFKDVRLYSVNYGLTAVLRDLGLIDKLTTKVSRHTWATLAKHLGVSKDVISECLGHRGGAITETYLADYDRSVLDAANRAVIDYICAVDG